jgi:sugar/nucleoside kinase (ribokinase family)
MRLRGVETRHIIVDPDQKTGLSVILSRKDERAILTYSGAIDALRADQVDRELMGQCRHMHVASYYLQSTLRPDVPSLLAEAKQCGLTVSLDTNWDPSEGWDGGVDRALSFTDIFLPNEQEAIAISRCSNMKAALEKLASQVDTVAIKRGNKGAIAQRGSERVNCNAFPVEVVDTTGAGDSFNAGFICGFIKGYSLLDSLRMACACGALSTRALGGIESQPTIDQVTGFLNVHR